MNYYNYSCCCCYPIYILFNYSPVYLFLNSYNCKFLCAIIMWLFCNEQNHLLPNTNRTKELVVDLSKTTQTHTVVNIQGSDVEIVDAFK